MRVFDFQAMCVDRRVGKGLQMWLRWWLCMALCVTVVPISAGDWPQWRGPARDARSVETGLLSDWTGDGPRSAWHASGLGLGYSSVVVSRGRVITIGRHGDDLYCHALDMSNGKRVWSVAIGKTARIPCSTPTVDGNRVYVLDPDGELLCLDWGQGTPIWQVSYTRDFAGQMQSGRGYGESPLIDGEKLVCTPGGPQAMIVALNKHTGSVIWKATCPDLGSSGRDGAGFSSIVSSRAAGQRQYVQLVGRGLVGVAAADGRFLWGYNQIANRTANIPTPVVRGDLVFSANGYNAGSVLLKLTAGPDATVRAQKVYDLNGSRFQNHHGGVVLIGDYLYGGHGSNNGLPTCLDFETGRVVWKRRGPGVGSAAVVAADGHLYFRYQNGVVGLLEASENGYHLKGTLRIPGAGADSWSHPVVAHARLFLREKDDLWVYDLAKQKSVVPLTRTIDPDLKADPTLLALWKDGVVSQLLRHRNLREAVSTRDTAYNPLFAYVENSEWKDASRPVLLTLTNAHVTETGVIRAAVLDQLRRVSRPMILKLAGTRAADQCLAQFSQFQNLVGLDLELCNRLTDSGFKHLATASELRVLLLAGTRVNRAGLAELSKLQHLRALDLEVCDGVADSACKELAALKHLRALVLKKTGFEPLKITDAGLKVLSRLEHLERLNLYGNGLSDAGLVHLAAMPRLQALSLDLLGITDVGLKELKSLKQLRDLSLIYAEGFAGPKITDDGLPALAELANLQMLNLTGAAITDAGLVQMQSHASLRTLVVVNTRLSERGLARLQQALPQCRIVR